VDWAFASGNAVVNPEMRKRPNTLAATETLRDILDNRGILSH
jgi:hypothetical protein